MADSTTALDDLKKYFLAQGSSEEELNRQLEKVGKLILLETTTSLLRQKPPTEKLQNEEAVASYLEANFTPEEIRAATDKVSQQVVLAYLESLKA